MADETLSVKRGTMGSFGMRYHELALRRWFDESFFVREGFPIPSIFASPMDAFSEFDKLWSSVRNPFNYLLNLKDDQGGPLYEPYPSNLRYPLISIFRRGWKYRPEQNYSIHQFRHINWPTVSDDVGKCELGNVTVGYRPMAWSYKFQIDHYAMRPDTQAYFVETLMRSMWRTGGTPQTWITVHYPGWGFQNVRMYIEGDIESTTLEAPEDGKAAEFRTSLTLILEGYSVDQDFKFLPALWTLIIGNGTPSPAQLETAINPLASVDLRFQDNNPTLDSRLNVPSDAECQHELANAFRVYPVHKIILHGSDAKNDFGFTSTNPGSPYFSGGIQSNLAFGLPTIILGGSI